MEIKPHIWFFLYLPLNSRKLFFYPIFKKKNQICHTFSDSLPSHNLPLWDIFFFLFLFLDLLYPTSPSCEIYFFFELIISHNPLCGILFILIFSFFKCPTTSTCGFVHFFFVFFKCYNTIWIKINYYFIKKSFINNNYIID